jgi:hypothetical protein
MHVVFNVVCFDYDCVYIDVMFVIVLSFYVKVDLSKN